MVFWFGRHTEMKTMSQSLTSVSGVSRGMPPICFNESPRDMVRFQYFNAGSDPDVRCLWMLFAIARPMDPRPIHPRRGESDEDMFEQF